MFLHLTCLFSQYTFNDLSGSVSLAWVGDGTGVSVFPSTPIISPWQYSLFIELHESEREQQC